MAARNIGVITKYVANCYHGGLIHAIHQALIKNGANMYVINTFMIHRFYNGQEKDLLYYKLALNHIDGWIVLSEGANEQFIEMIHNTGKPVVTIGFTPEKIKCPVIKEDSRYSGEAVTQHLIDHGHKKIVFIGCLYLEDMYKRFDGYKRALEKNLIPFDPNLCIQTETGASSFGKSGIQQMLVNGCEFTAVFGANDFLALGAMRALKEVGLSIPEDVAVIGYDDTSHAESSNPSLTSVRQDYLGLGTAAVEALMKSMAEKVFSSETTYIKSNLVIRNSCECKKQSKRKGPHTNGDKLKVTLEYLEEELSKNIDISFDLLKTDINGIKKIASKIVSRYRARCIGYWYMNSDKDKKLIIEEVIDIKSKTKLTPNMVCPIEDFPPAEFIPCIKDYNTDDIVWILPITTVSRDWCIIAYVSSFNVESISLAYDSWTILLNLLGSFLDHEITNAELKNTLETLQKTQEQLIQSEKMVSLGTLVAGVAHEINTPIGVSVTAASFMQENSHKLMELFESGKLKRSDMEKYFKLSIETNDILLINLSKASNLIKSFKQIAVDQSNEEKRMFNVNNYINEVLLSLNPKLKMTKLIVNTDCPKNLEIYSCPGGLSQILTNLLVNSIIHAYDEGEEGTISIKISTENDTMKFIYSDDGKGISKDTVSKIFDPFFTTKRGTGGTGLGLNIVYNIVTQQYCGTIKCESVFGNGTTFIINIPIQRTTK